ncbi:putative aminopeptidase P [Prochlorococcus marinus str. MIT 9515]|uniref:Xaa-Pro aminopeptidase n=1 Tax=Prochlorococcus marinus (strain MIT 9515) TaxID=167542 RepID=A2BYG7_PROM5|nr:aminopeptidase P N-terminal domain-containing protein [Prochlorococcus marinus]ABM72828.1 putative aminopeptidase P [Prochlorococcus marinus str. MIT 9515]
MFKTNTKIFEERREIFLKKLNGKAAIISSSSLVNHHADCEYPFRQDSNFWYLTGFDEPDSIALFLSNKPKGERYILFVAPKDIISEVWHGFRWGVEGAEREFKADKAHSISDFKRLLPVYISDSEDIVYSQNKHSKFEKIVLEIFSKQIEARSKEGKEEINIESPEIYLNEMRLIKSDFEISRMREATQISAEAHELVRESISLKKNERQIQGLIEGFFLEKGARGPAYNSIVASGDNACILHYTLNNSDLNKGDLLLVDAGCSLMDYYNGDITRTIPIGGKFSKEQKIIYEIVLEAQKNAIKHSVKGSNTTNVHNVALRILVDGLKEIGLLRGDTDGIIENGSYKHLYMHRTGHWLGLDVHDVGAYRMGEYDVPLQNGMILTVEPGIYISDRIPVPEGQPSIDEKWKGIGIRIEDDILVKEKEPEILSIAALKEISDLEY